MVDDVLLHRHVLTIVHSDGRCKVMVERAALDVAWLDLCDSAEIQEGEGVARIVGVVKSILTDAREFDIGETGIT